MRCNRRWRSYAPTSGPVNNQTDSGDRSAPAGPTAIAPRRATRRSTAGIPLHLAERPPDLFAQLLLDELRHVLVEPFLQHRLERIADDVLERRRTGRQSRFLRLALVFAVAVKRVSRGLDKFRRRRACLLTAPPRGGGDVTLGAVRKPLGAVLEPASGKQAAPGAREAGLVKPDGERSSAAGAAQVVAVKDGEVIGIAPSDFKGAGSGHEPAGGTPQSGTRSEAKGPLAEKAGDTPLGARPTGALSVKPVNRAGDAPEAGKSAVGS